MPTTDDAGAAHAGTANADVVVLGGPVGAAVVRRLQEEDHAAKLVDSAHLHPDRPAGPAESKALVEAGLDSASTVVVATASDSLNLLIAQLVRVRFDVDRVVVLVHEPDRVPALVDAGHDPLCATTTLADALVDRL